MKLHEVRSEWWGDTVDLEITCPYQPDEERGCRLQPETVIDGEHCAARHYLLADGPRALHLFGHGWAKLPFWGQVYWVDNEVVVVKPMAAYWQCAFCGQAFDAEDTCTCRAGNPPGGRGYGAKAATTTLDYSPPRESP